MKFRLTILGLAIFAVAGAQVAGGQAYRQQSGRAEAEANERAKRGAVATESPSANSVFIDASVLINVQADEYVAVFGASVEGPTLDECAKKMSATITTLKLELANAGVKNGAVGVDFISQNRIFGYDVQGDLAKEKLIGFEFKKNVSVRFKKLEEFDGLVAAASRAQVFDLIKVDYVVQDMDAIENRLMEAATQVTKRKLDNQRRLLGIAVKPIPQVLAEKYASYSPSDMYENYAAFEAENVSGGAFRQNLSVQNLRKVRTFYYNGLSSRSFDKVINPVITDPPVQFTLYLKLRYDLASGVVGQPPKKSAKSNHH